ncbi:putative N-acetyltransferase YsnE [Oxobacter pfennigii]|uniref:Putative N-acetyltransferase YsnE n=1 Tax=Oxobacter pfennigii TaxID=36849 RepID=A0A0P8WKZ6_9CLOT|nr:GNAT family N-acetyltransferase [Oxobacter pfennigii]KPU43043.1 putative N-acetyltransferase YsnE [Oxobacter pfennigii]
MKILKVHDDKNLEVIKGLFMEYAESLGIDLGFQNFKEELDNLPGGYAAPEGRLMLAYSGDAATGCIALRKIDNVTCEMKRLYIRPEFRGQGLSRIMAEELIKEAKKAGYKYMRLDTLPSMNAAIGLYKSLGFISIEPYRFNPIEGAMFFELVL